MPPIGTSRGYGSNPDDDNEASAPVVSYEMHEHEEEVGGHGHEAPVNPDWIEPSDSTLDDVYISAGKRPIDPAPIGWMTPDRILDNMIPPPLAYAIDWRRIIVAGFWATLVFTPIWYCVYFGYRDSCFDLGLVLGSIVSPALDWTTRLVGLGIHFGVGIGIAVTYAYLLMIFRTQSSGGRGSQFGIGLCFAMMSFILPVFIGTIARLVPWNPTFEMPDMLLQQAGPANCGYGPLVIALVAHLFYGMIVGGLYRHKVVVRQSETLLAHA